MCQPGRAAEVRTAQRRQKPALRTDWTEGCKCKSAAAYKVGRLGRCCPVQPAALGAGMVSWLQVLSK